MDALREQFKKIIFMVDLNEDNLKEASSLYGGVYSTLIDMIETDGLFSLEVQTDLDTIVLSLMLEPLDAHIVHEFLDEYLRKAGIPVYKRFQDFEESVLTRQI